MAHGGVHIRGKSNAPQMAEVAALVGDPARANILCALLGGRALTATELAFAAGVTPQTTSGHLGKLHAARLLVLMKQGRHRYYRLAGPHVGQMLEGIMNVALAGPPRAISPNRAWKISCATPAPATTISPACSASALPSG